MGGIGSGLGVGLGGTGSGAGPGGIGSGRGDGGSGSIGGMTISYLLGDRLSLPGRGPAKSEDGSRYRRGMLDPEVLAYYERDGERERLTRDWGRLEWARTWELLERFLPAPPSVVLDVGGGPGAYAVPLALAGHSVHLVDAVPLHIERAQLQAQAACVSFASASVADARSLPLADRAADAVLLLGPLYHLLEAEDRASALAEALRVLRPGGVLLAVGISRFASLYDGLTRGWAAEEPHIVEGALRTGVHRNPEARPNRFTTAHFARPEELAGEVAAAGFQPVALLAVEGPATVIKDAAPWLDDRRRREWLLRAIRRVEAEPSLLGASAHVMSVARAPLTDPAPGPDPVPDRDPGPVPDAGDSAAARS